MIQDVFKSVSKTSEIDEIIIVSPDTEVLKLTHEFGFTTILEKKQLGVNIAVTIANKYCLNKGATSTLVLPADIPLIQPKDIKKIIETTKNSKSVVIIPSNRFDGTNALLRTPPNIIKTSYDKSSYKLHKQNSFNEKISIYEIHLKSIMLDLDIPEDIKEFMKIPSNTDTYRFLLEEKEISKQE